LKKLERDVAAAIKNFDSRVKAEAVFLEEHARSLGFSLSELTSMQITKTRKRVHATTKYRNPANLSETWSGRGRKPRWYDALITSGVRVDNLNA
jgi:DNA-binding protein H-NS